jgi:hypothetical protein
MITPTRVFGATALLLVIGVLAVGSRAIAGGLGERLDVHVATGDSPYAVVDGAISKPKRLAIRTTEDATDPVEGSMDLLCVKGSRSDRDLRDFHVDGRRIIRFKPTLARADRCSLSVNVFSAGRGRIKLEVFGTRRHR